MNSNSGTPPGTFMYSNINSSSPTKMVPIGMSQFQSFEQPNSSYHPALNLNMERMESAYRSRKPDVVVPPALKTPVSLLNEVCAKANIIPQFETSEDGPPHERVFECTVKLDRQGSTWEGKGKAKSKKDARQEAAKTLLLSMDEQVEKLLVPIKPTIESISPAIECDPEVEGNPIGDLNDLCLKIKRQPPEYEEIGEEGKPHERVYTVACKLGNQIAEQGRGRTKRNAKKVAALKVKQHLNELMVNAEGLQVQAQPGKEEEESLIDKIQGLSMGKKSKTPIESFKLSTWFAEFKGRSGEKLGNLQDTSKITSTCPTKLLKEIAEEQKFKVEYLDLDTASSGDTEDHRAIVSLGIEPMAIFIGTGGSKTQGRKSASAKAIEFLQIAVSQK